MRAAPRYGGDGDDYYRSGGMDLPDFDTVVSQLRSRDGKARLEAATCCADFAASVELEESQIFDLTDALVSVLNDNNCKITQGALCGISALIDATSIDFSPRLVPVIVPPVTERLGDMKPAVRQAAEDVLLLLMTHVVSPSMLFERLKPFLNHRNRHIREHVLSIFTKTIQCFGPKCVVLTQFLPSFVSLLEDPNQPVREACACAVETIYKYVGPELVRRLEKSGVRAGQVKWIMERLEQVRVEATIDNRSSFDLTQASDNLVLQPEGRRILHGVKERTLGRAVPEAENLDPNVGDDDDGFLNDNNGYSSSNNNNYGYADHNSNSNRNGGGKPSSTSTKTPRYSFGGGSNGPAVTNNNINNNNNDGIDIIDVHSERELQQEMEALAATLRDTKSEDWSARFAAIRRLQGIVLGNGIDLPSFPTHLRLFLGPLGEQVMDLRSAIAREACSLLGILSQVLGIQFESHAEHFLRVLFKTLAVTTTVISDAANTAIKVILSNTQSPRLLPVVFEGIGSKSGSVRSRSLEFLRMILLRWEPRDLDRYLDQIESLLKVAIADAQGDVRAAARGCVKALMKSHENRGKSLLGSFDAATQKKIFEINLPTLEELDSQPVATTSSNNNNRRASLGRQGSLNDGSSSSNNNNNGGSLSAFGSAAMRVRREEDDSSGPSRGMNGSNGNTNSNNAGNGTRKRLSVGGAALRVERPQSAVASTTATTTNVGNGASSSGIPRPKSAMSTPSGFSLAGAIAVPTATPLTTTTNAAYTTPSAIPSSSSSSSNPQRVSMLLSGGVATTTIVGGSSGSERGTLSTTSNVPSSSISRGDTIAMLAAAASSVRGKGRVSVGGDGFGGAMRVTVEPKNIVTPMTNTTVSSTSNGVSYQTKETTVVDTKKAPPTQSQRSSQQDQRERDSMRAVRSKSVPRPSVRGKGTEDAVLAILDKANAPLWSTRAESFAQLSEMVRSDGQRVLNHLDRIIDLMTEHINDPHYKVVAAVLEALVDFISDFSASMSPALDRILPRVFARAADAKVTSLCESLLEVVHLSYGYAVSLPAVLRALDLCHAKAKSICLAHISANLAAAVPALGPVARSLVNKLIPLMVDRTREMRVAGLRCCQELHRVAPVVFFNSLSSLSFESRATACKALSAVMPGIEDELVAFERHQQANGTVAAFPGSDATGFGGEFNNNNNHNVEYSNEIAASHKMSALDTEISNVIQETQSATSRLRRVDSPSSKGYGHAMASATPPRSNDRRSFANDEYNHINTFNNNNYDNNPIGFVDENDRGEANNNNNNNNMQLFNSSKRKSMGGPGSSNSNRSRNSMSTPPAGIGANYGEFEEDREFAPRALFGSVRRNGGAAPATTATSTTANLRLSPAPQSSTAAITPGSKFVAASPQRPNSASRTVGRGYASNASPSPAATSAASPTRNASSSTSVVPASTPRSGGRSRVPSYPALVSVDKLLNMIDAGEEEQRRWALQELTKASRDRDLRISAAFGQILVLIASSVGPGRSAREEDGYLMLLRELLRNQSDCFEGFEELAVETAVKAFSGESIHDVSMSAEEVLSALVANIHPEVILRVAVPMASRDLGSVMTKQAVLRLIIKATVQLPPSMVESALPTIISPLLAAFNHPSAEVRKTVVFGIVEIWKIVGDPLKSYLQTLNTSQMKLVTIYINRQISMQQ